MNNTGLNMKPMVVNKKTVKGRLANSVYIGRPSMWGNPFVIGQDGSRADVVRKYKKWVVKQPDLMGKLDLLRGKHLICYCAPLSCHGDVLLRLANAEPLRCE
jgi:hypothetical protein